MAQYICPKCEKELADHAAPCPGCGFRFRTSWVSPMSRRHALLGAVLLAGMAIFASWEGDKTSAIPFLVICGVLLLMAKYTDS